MSSIFLAFSVFVILWASSKLGLYFPCSSAFIVCLVTSTFVASSSWVSFKDFLSCFIFVFMLHFFIEMPVEKFVYEDYCE